MQIYGIGLIGLAFSALSSGASEHQFYYFKEARFLDLNAAKIAFLSKSGTDHDRTQQLSSLGIAYSSMEAHPVAGWYLVETSNSLRSQSDVRQSIDSISANSAFEFASPVFFDLHNGPMLVTPEIHVGFAEQITAERAEEILQGNGRFEILQRDWAGMKGVYRLRSLSRNGFDVLAEANRLAQLSEIVFAEPDWISTGKSGWIPNDPLFGNLWGLRNTGQNGGTADMDMDADLAWDITAGDPNIIVTVFDVGVELNHPDLNLVPGNDLTGNNTAGAPLNACDNHGTAVAGCISGIIHNGAGIVGVAPDCPVASAKIGVANTNCQGSWTGPASWTVDAINWAENIGSRVTNNSNSYGNASAAITTAYRNTRNRGMVHFASAGNDSRDSLGYPSSVDAVNAVAALDRQGARAGFSNWGNGLDFSAPGAAILTTDRLGPNGYATGDFVSMNGTSFASPYAAGVAALVLSANPNLTAPEVEQILQNSCVNLGADGYDTDFGWGFINANNAVRAVVPCPPPPADRSQIFVNLNNNSGCENGTTQFPYNTVAEGTQFVADSGTAQIQAGHYRENLRLNRVMVFRSLGGVARIGP